MNQFHTNLFAKTQTIIEYLEIDENKLKELNNKGVTKIEYYIFSRYHNFVRFTLNKIIHRKILSV